MKKTDLLKGKNILLGVCGVSTAYRSINLSERLKQLGANVRVVLSDEAKKYVTARTFERVSGEGVIVEQSESRKNWQDLSGLTAETDLTLIAPASFSFTGKLSSGLGKDLLTELISRSNNPVLLAPSMSRDLYASETVRAHLKKIKETGFYIVEPKPWGLEETSDREPLLTIVVGRIIKKIREVLQEDQLLENRKVLVTSGPTRDLFSLPNPTGEAKDSSLGYNLSNQARQMGGEVQLVSGPTEQIPPTGVGVVWTRSVEELDEMLTGELDYYDLILMASSASDWRPELASDFFEGEKTKRLDLDIPETPDLARKLGRLKNEDQVLVEFRTGPEVEGTDTRERLVENDIDGLFSVKREDPDEKEEKHLIRGSFYFKTGEEANLQAQNGSRLSREILREIGKRFFQ
jgi:phosphopantothenoylcysteine decarboxylase/phosphopantothenate--cysteine ligase